MIRNTGPVRVTPPDPYIKLKKLKELAVHGTDLWGETPEAGGSIARAGELLGVKADNIVDLSLGCEEDLAILDNGKLSAICFCFPSGFVPRERVGLTLADIHKPVADGEQLVRASPKIAETLCRETSMRRWVWTLTANPNHSNHPSHRGDNYTANTLNDLYFRWETQTTLSLGPNSALFLVHVNVVPLGEVWQENSAQIRASINSMSEAVIDYKNLRTIRDLVNATE